MSDQSDSEKCQDAVRFRQDSATNSNVLSSDTGSFVEKAGYKDAAGVRSHRSVGSTEELPDFLGHGIGNDLGITPKEVGVMQPIIDQIPIEEAREIVRKLVKDHKGDKNMLPATYNALKELSNEDSDKTGLTPYDRDYAIRTVAAVMHHHSPYPEVRAVTSHYDDYEEVCETPRSYILGVIWVIVGSGVNQFFSPRNPPLTLPASLFQLLILPCGWLWASIMPDFGFTFLGAQFRWNPGPWTKKEQMLVTLMFNITSELAYAHHNILVQKLDVFYGNKWVTAGFQITLTLSSQCLGFALAGLMRSILVYPVRNLWMTNFPIIALNRSLMTPEVQETVHGWTMTRYKFFCVVSIAIFFYQWIPGYLMQFLSTFNWMTWIQPSNLDLANITGSVGGLGINPITTFDWTIIQISYPMVTPFFAQIATFAGALLSCAVLIPAVYYSNMYYSGYLPINSNKLWTNKAQHYDVRQILTDDSLFDAKKYQKYSPPYYSAGNLVVYGSYFAGYTCIFVRSLLYDWRIMYEGFYEVYLSLIGRGKGINAYDDAHSRMMQRYKEAPLWWYLAVALVSIALGIVSIKCYPTTTPVWGLFLGIALGVVFLVPIGMLYSQTNVLFSLNVLAELIAGYALPGRGIALMMIKAFGLNINQQAMYFLRDLKMGHYAKVPPRASFRAQLVATIISGFVVLGVMNWQISNIDDLCSDKLASSSRFTCPGDNTYFAASVQWGTIGPARVFNSLYPILKWCFLIGCAIPIPYYVIDRFFPKYQRYTRFFEPTVMIMGIINYAAPYNLSYITMGVYFSYFFMHYIRVKKIAWFEKYNYVLYAALSAGSAISTMIIFFSVQYHPKDLNWWGNTGPFSGKDGTINSDGIGRLKIPKQGYFGPAPGTYDVST